MASEPIWLLLNSKTYITYHRPLSLSLPETPSCPSFQPASRVVHLRVESTLYGLNQTVHLQFESALWRQYVFTGRCGDKKVPLRIKFKIHRVIRIEVIVHADRSKTLFTGNGAQERVKLQITTDFPIHSTLKLTISIDLRSDTKDKVVVIRLVRVPAIGSPRQSFLYCRLIPRLWCHPRHTKRTPGIEIAPAVIFDYLNTVKGIGKS
ncbi:hypothetical protein DBW_2767 [Desulfuromonas sp. DDH964]|nr:hypothetical protein DBW_2767 [Desulfuromonas sp. DDH964]